MFVVMAVGASEAEVLGVKSQILAEGLNPFEHAGAERVVIAVVGEIGARQPVLIERFAALPGVETVTPISRPFKLTSREFHPEDTVIRVLDSVIGDGSLTMMAGPVLGRDAATSCSRPPTRSRPPARRSCAAAPSSRGPARTPSRAWASRRSATSPRRATGPACRSSPR